MWYPPKRDRMAGKYLAYWWLPPAVSSRHASAGRWRRHKEKGQVQRYAGIARQAEAAMDDADNDISDCRHGCCGRPAPCVDERCNFTCHEDDPEQSGHGDWTTDEHDQ